MNQLLTGITWKLCLTMACVDLSPNGFLLFYFETRQRQRQRQRQIEVPLHAGQTWYGFSLPNQPSHSSF